MGIYEELEKEYKRDYERIQNGEQIDDPLGATFKSYALDAVDFSKEVFNIELNFSEESIELVEKILDSLSESIVVKKPSEEQILDMAKKFAGYVSEVIRAKWGGKYIREEEYGFSNGPALKIDDHNFFILSKVYRRMKNGSEDNVWDFYKIIKSDLQKESSSKKKKTWHNFFKR